MNARLELGEILSQYNSYLLYEDNKESKLSFSTDGFYLDLHHQRLVGFEAALGQGIEVPNVEVPSLLAPFEKLKKTGALNVAELYSFIFFFRSIEALISAFAPFERGEVRELIADLVNFRQLRKKLELTILPDLSISSVASSRLRSTRDKIEALTLSLASAAKKAQEKYRDYLVDDNIGLKNGYSVISVKSSSKGAVDGLETATSNSGNTTFIVPKEVLTITGEILTLKEAEQEEIKRIIAELSALLKSRLEEMEKVYRTCLIIDQCIGAVRYGRSYDGLVAASGDLIELDGLGHPLIARERLVRNSLRLGGESPRRLLISGPNAGGKTVFIKSVALAAILNQAGLFVPASSRAALPIFSDVFFLSGDNQSVVDNLSTFSAHVQELKSVVAKMDRDSLVIVDEIGQGTAPQEGSALGAALFAQAKKIGCYMILTSHYEDLKDLALADSSILSGSMIFDEEKLEPTFSLVYGRAGKSFGLSVAEKLGLQPEVISAAKSFMESWRDAPQKQSLDELNLRLEQLEEERRAMVEEAAKLKELEDKKLAELQRATAERRELKERGEEIVERAVEEKLAEIDKIWNRQKPIVNFADMSRLKGELKKIEAQPEAEVMAAGQFAVGDRVRLVLSGQQGIVTGFRGSRYQVEADGLNFNLRADQLEKLRSKTPVRVSKTHEIDRLLQPRSSVGLECNLIGMRVDEAMDKLRSYLYDCLVAHRHQVRIVHGVGTGALQRATHQLLRNFKEVESFRFGGEGEGGVGCTVVLFR